MTLTPSAILSLALSEALFGDYPGEETVLESAMLDDEEDADAETDEQHQEQNADQQETKENRYQINVYRSEGSGNKTGKKSEVRLYVVDDGDDDGTNKDSEAVESEVHVIESETTQDGNTKDGENSVVEIESHDIENINETTGNVTKPAKREHKIIKILRKIKHGMKTKNSKGKGTVHVINVTQESTSDENKENYGIHNSRTIIELKKIDNTDNIENTKNNGKQIIIKANLTEIRRNYRTNETSKIQNENKKGDNKTNKTEGKRIHIKTKIKASVVGNNKNKGVNEGSMNISANISTEMVQTSNLKNGNSGNDTIEKISDKRIQEIREELAKDYRELDLLKNEIQKKLKYIRYAVVGDEFANADINGSTSVGVRNSGQGNKTIVVNSRVVVKTKRPQTPKETRDLVRKLVHSILGTETREQKLKGLFEARNMLQQLIYTISVNNSSSIVVTEAKTHHQSKTNENLNSTVLATLTGHFMLKENRESEKTRKKRQLLLKSKTQTQRFRGNKLKQLVYRNAYGIAVDQSFNNEIKDVDDDDGRGKQQHKNKAFNNKDGHATTQDLNKTLDGKERYDKTKHTNTAFDVGDRLHKMQDLYKSFNGNDTLHTTENLNKAFHDSNRPRKTQVLNKVFDGNNERDKAHILNKIFDGNNGKTRTKRAEEDVLDDVGDASNEDYFVAIGTEPGDKVIEVDPEKVEDEDSGSEEMVFEFIEEDANAGYENWNAWGTCSVTCGVGHRQRTRRCLDYEHCRSGNIEITPCKMAACDDANW